MFRLLVIGSGGFIGAVLRYQVSGWVHKGLGTAFPYGTLAVNVLGSFLLGLFLVLADTKLILSDLYKQFIAIGILGAFTTFSTFSYETFALIEGQLFKQALMNMSLNLLLGLLAVWLGIVVARVI